MFDPERPKSCGCATGLTRSTPGLKAGILSLNQDRNRISGIWGENRRYLLSVRNWDRFNVEGHLFDIVVESRSGATVND